LDSSFALPPISRQVTEKCDATPRCLRARSTYSTQLVDELVEERGRWWYNRSK